MRLGNVRPPSFSESINQASVYCFLTPQRLISRKNLRGLRGTGGVSPAGRPTMIGAMGSFQRKHPTPSSTAVYSGPQPQVRSGKCQARLHRRQALDSPPPASNLRPRTAPAVFHRYHQRSGGIEGVKLRACEAIRRMTSEEGMNTVRVRGQPFFHVVR